MPKSTQITKNAWIVPTVRKNWNDEAVFEITIDGKVVGEIYRATHTIQIMAKSGNYSVGSRTRKGWEWRIKRTVARELGIIGKFNSRTTSYVLFSSKMKAATDLVELILTRTVTEAKIEVGH